MLLQQYRDILVATILAVLPDRMDGQMFFNFRQGMWNVVVPTGTTYKNEIEAIVAAADAQNWLRDLVRRLADANSHRSEFRVVLAEIDRPSTVQTVANPFEEVLLDSNRPFVNRRPLRAQLLNLLDIGGSPVLMVDGDPKTGKSYSYYLINHVAPSKDFTVNKFKMTHLPKPDDLAGEILDRLGVSAVLPPMGNESAERWADKLAAIIARAINDRKLRPLLVFDEFPFSVEPDGTVVHLPLPEGTASLIIRLAIYADEELRPRLRVVLMRFPGTLPQELDDVALRDKAQPFTATDMVAAVMQVAKARNWSVTEAAVQAKIEDYHQASGRSLNDRFIFLRGLLQELATATP